jgi:hypothetical protein
LVGVMSTLAVANVSAQKSPIKETPYNKETPYKRDLSSRYSDAEFKLMQKNMRYMLDGLDINLSSKSSRDGISAYIQHAALSPIGKRVDLTSPHLDQKIGSIIKEANPTYQIVDFLEEEYLKYMPAYLKAESVKKDGFNWNIYHHANIYASTMSIYKEDIVIDPQTSTVTHAKITPNLTLIVFDWKYDGSYISYQFEFGKIFGFFGVTKITKRRNTWVSSRADYYAYPETVIFPRPKK